MKRFFKSAICVSLITAAIALPAAGFAAANSAMPYWEGTTSSGSFIQDCDCPVKVEKETLTFDIGEFPEKYYGEDNKDKFSAYSAKVTAEYELYNPEDYEISVHLAFPFGNSPSYAYAINTETAADSDKYEVKVDGQAIERTLRHTYSPYDYSYEKSDVKKLRDGFKEHAYFSPDDTVTKYTVKFDLQENGTKAQVVYDYKNFSLFYGFGTDKVTDVRRIYEKYAECYLYKDNVYEFYLVGASTADGLNFKFTDANGNPVYNVYTNITVKEMTFKDFALTYKTEGVSETDWYNAVLESIDNWGYINVKYYLMRWYEYSVTIAPKGRAVNSVTAPLYPSIDDRRDTYGYNYLLSPAKDWAEFDELEVIINTPYYLSNCSLGEPVKAENCYKYISYGLPEGELTFNLSESEANVRFPSHGVRYNPVWIVFGIFAGLSLIPFIGVAVGVPVYLHSKKRK